MIIYLKRFEKATGNLSTVGTYDSTLLALDAREEHERADTDHRYTYYFIDIGE